MKYRQLKEISAVTLVEARPSILRFVYYLYAYGYEPIMESNFGAFIRHAILNSWIDWLIESRFIEKVEKTYYIGQEFEHAFMGEEGIYLLTCLDKTTGLVRTNGLYRGSQVNGAMVVNDRKNITEEEFVKITGNEPESFKLIEE